MHRGYTKRWRKRWDKGYHHDPILWLLMDYFIDHANHKDKEIYFPGIGKIPLKRGQHIYGTNKLAEFLGVSRQRIRTKLKILENIGFLTIKTTNKYSIASVINYDIYQPLPEEIKQQTNQQLSSSQPAPNQQLTTPNKDKKDNKEKENIYTSDFLEFWETYPRKVGKGAAFKAWKKANGKPSVKNLIQIIGRQAQSEQWRQDGGKFIPHPTTWLNQRRWEDELERSPIPTTPEGDLEKWLKQCNENK